MVVTSKRSLLDWAERSADINNRRVVYYPTSLMKGIPVELTYVRAKLATVRLDGMEVDKVAFATITNTPTTSEHARVITRANRIGCGGR